MHPAANRGDRSGLILGQEVTPGCLCGKHVSRKFASDQPRGFREKVPCPHSLLSGLLICQMTLASDSDGRFAQEQSLHQGHSWRSIRGELRSPGQSCQGRGSWLGNGSFQLALCISREGCTVLGCSGAVTPQWKVSRVTPWGGEVKVRGVCFQVLTCCVVPVRRVKQWHVRARGKLRQSLTKVLINTVKSAQ